MAHAPRSRRTDAKALIVERFMWFGGAQEGPPALESLAIGAAVLGAGACLLAHAITLLAALHHTRRRFVTSF